MGSHIERNSNGRLNGTDLQHRHSMAWRNFEMVSNPTVVVHLPTILCKNKSVNITLLGID
jgi:hypothetical protein